MGLSANRDGRVRDVVSRAAEIVDLIKKKITFQEYLPGDVLPKEETLALQFSVS